MSARKAHDVVARVAELVGRAPDGHSVTASWTDAREWEAGVTANNEGVEVYYGPAGASVESLEEAAALLKGIFADEIVCVTALENETPVHHALARHDDPSASFAMLDRSRSTRDMPEIDNVMVRSWTGRRDRE